MPLLPYQTFGFETPLAPDEASARLAAAVRERSWFRQPAPGQALEGEVSGETFRVYRVIGYRNSFLPIVHGRLVPTAEGSRVEGVMTLHPFVLVFMLVWCGGVVVAAVSAWSGGGALGRSAALLPLAMLVFGWALSAGGFTAEAGRTLRTLRAALAEDATQAPAT